MSKKINFFKLAIILFSISILIFSCDVGEEGSENNPGNGSVKPGGDTPDTPDDPNIPVVPAVFPNLPEVLPDYLTVESPKEIEIYYTTNPVSSAADLLKIDDKSRFTKGKVKFAVLVDEAEIKKAKTEADVKNLMDKGSFKVYFEIGVNNFLIKEIKSLYSISGTIVNDSKLSESSVYTEIEAFNYYPVANSSPDRIVQRGALVNGTRYYFFHNTSSTLKPNKSLPTMALVADSFYKLLDDTINNPGKFLLTTP